MKEKGVIQGVLYWDEVIPNVTKIVKYANN